MMGRGWLSLGLLPLLMGCDLLQPEIADCEAYILVGLKAPSTYKRISADRWLTKEDGVEHVRVTINYDVANVYGTPVREFKVCLYPVVNGKPDLNQMIDDDKRISAEVQETLDLMEEAAREAAMEAVAETP